MIRLTHKNILIILIVTLVLASCSETKNKKEGNSSSQEVQKTSLNKIEHKDSVFLNLSPKMTNDEFENALNQQPELNLKDKKFQIIIGEQTLNFRIIKNQNAISLKYYSKNLLRVEKNTVPIKKYYNNLISIFKKKYKPYEIHNFRNKSNFEHFTKEYLKNKNNDSLLLQNLVKYNFDKVNYSMFRDSVKTIMIGHSFEHNFFSSLVNKSKGNNSEIFNHTIQIDYFLTKGFDSIERDILLDYNKYVLGVNNDKLLREKIKENNKNQSKKNLNKL